MLRFDRKQQNSVKQLSFNKKKTNPTKCGMVILNTSLVFNLCLLLAVQMLRSELVNRDETVYVLALEVCWIRQGLPTHVGRWNGSGVVCIVFLRMAGFSSLWKSGPSLRLKIKSHLVCVMRLPHAQFFLLTWPEQGCLTSPAPALRGGEVGWVLSCSSQGRRLAPASGPASIRPHSQAQAAVGAFQGFLSFPSHWDKIHVA